MDILEEYRAAIAAGNWSEKSHTAFRKRTFQGRTCSTHENSGPALAWAILLGITNKNSLVQPHKAIFIAHGNRNILSWEMTVLIYKADLKLL